MRGEFVISVIAGILILGTLGLAPVDSFAEVISGSTSLGGGIFQLVAPPIPGPSGICPPNSVGNNCQQTPDLWAFDEVQSVVLTVPLAVGDITGDGITDAGATLPAGTVVSSHYVWIDPGPLTRVQGCVEFDSPVLATIFSNTQLGTSDPILENPDVNYVNSGARGFEASQNDIATFSGNQVCVDLDAGNPGDYFRVITTGKTLFSIFNTGVDNNGTPLSLGSGDTHFVVVETGNQAEVLFDQSGAWVHDSANSLWVWVTSDNTQNINAIFTFKTTFDLTGFDPSTAQIDGRIAVDNALDGIKLNGVSLPNPGAGFSSFTPFTITSGFQSGINTLEFIARDFGAIAGFNVQLSGSAVVDEGADLSLVKTFEPETISPGDTFTYFLTVKNNGPNEAVNVVVTDDLPSEAPLDTTFIDVTPGAPVCTISSGKITCNLGNMAVNDEKFIGIVVKTHDEAPRGGFIINTATMTSDTEDPNPLNDEGNALIEIEIEGDLKLFKPDGSEILETQEEFPGGMVVVNDDNDNGNDVMPATFDLNDVGSTNNEDELVKLEIAKLTAPKGELYLNGDFGTDKVSVYKNSDRTNKITSFPVEVTESDVFFVEGLKSSFLTEVNFELTPLNQPLESLDLVRLTVIKIESITFSGNGNSFAKDNNLDDNINPATGNPLGERVFPGARIEGSPEMIGPFGSNDKVSVNVELSSVVPFDTEIFLKSFDVDDPGANMAPIDPNHDALGGTSGDYRNADNTMQYRNSVFPDRFVAKTLISYLTDEDNRGSVNGKKSGELLEHFDDANRDGTFDLGEILFDVNGNGSLDKEDADGIIKMVIKAGEKSNFVDLQVTRQPGDNFKVVAAFDKDFVNQLRNTDGIDGLEIFEKFVNARIANEKMSSDVLTVWRILHLEMDHMGAPHPIVTFDGAGTGNDDVGPFQDIGTFAIFKDLGVGTFTSSDFVLRKPDISMVNPAFNTQYIHALTIPEVSGLDDTDNLVFTRNLPDRLVPAAGAVVRDVPSTPTFWVVQLVGAYEGLVIEDNDPSPGELGATLGYAPESWVERPHQGFIYLETIRDLTLSTNPDMATRAQVEQRVVVHEVGHILSESHSGGLMSGNFAKNNPTYPVAGSSFTSAQQSAQRSLDRP